MFDRSEEFLATTRSLSPYLTSKSLNGNEAAPSKGPSPSALRKVGTQESFDLEAGIVKSAPLDDFLNQVEFMKMGMERIRKLMMEIEYLHKEALVAVGIDESTAMAKKIEAASASANKEASNLRKILKSIDSETRKFQQTDGVDPETKKKVYSASDLRLRRTQHQSYCKKFMTLMGQYEAMQMTYQNKYKQQLERQYLIVKPTATRDELESLHHDESSVMLSQQIFAMANKAQAQKTFTEMKERHEEILKIEKSINEVHQMFLDISFIVQQQGVMINKIDDYVQSTLEVTERAAEEMVDAVVKQRRAQRRRWILAVAGTIIIVLLVVFLVLGLADVFGGKK